MSNASQNFLAGFRLEDAPPPVAHQAKRCLLDLIGVAAAASGLEIARISGLVAGTQFGGAAARLPFDGRRASEAGVALHTAMTIDGFDAHDGHPLTKGHAGCNVLAGLLAFAGDGAGLSGGDALGHLVAGYEIAIRAGIALHATASDYHTSGAWGAVAVAGVGSRVLGLDPVRTREALGIAEYYGPRSQMMRVIDHPTMVKDGSGWGAMVGAVAALLAREGFTGAPAVTVEDEAVAGYWDDLGTRWRMLEQYFKPYPVCRWAQPAMEAAAQLRRDDAFDAAAVMALRVRTFREASLLAVRRPTTTDEAQYSLPFPLAALLVHGKVGPGEIDGPGLTDAEVLRLSSLVELNEDAGYSAKFPAERWAEVEIDLADGRRLVSRPAVARGSAENPLSDAEIAAKFRGLMEDAGFADRAAAIEDTVMSLDRAPSLAPLLDLVCAPVASRIPTRRGAVR